MSMLQQSYTPPFSTPEVPDLIFAHDLSWARDETIGAVRYFTEYPWPYLSAIDPQYRHQELVRWAGFTWEVARMGRTLFGNIYALQRFNSAIPAGGDEPDYVITEVTEQDIMPIRPWF